jgi:hypothetical protein
MPDELTADQENALRIARTLIDAGIPVFAAAPCPENCPTQGHQRTEFHLPKSWQKITPSYAQLRRWKPGWALAAMGGFAGDWLDEDRHHGGDVSVKELREADEWPRVYGEVITPSGGRHHLIAPLRERETNGLLPGLDYQGGDDSGQGRAFVWLAPTVKRSKNPEDAGALGTYAWVGEPDLEGLLEGVAAGDESGKALTSRIRAKAAGAVKALETPEVSAYPTDSYVESSQLFTDPRSGGGRQFTTDSAWEFVQPVLKSLRDARVGEIEENANRAAAMLSHFVPAFMTDDQAFSILTDALSKTAYDPDRPEATWHADKFRAVLDGRRPPRDNWRAEKIEADSFAAKSVQENASVDAVEALLAEMLTGRQIMDRDPPRPLVKGLLNLDSESWIIGEPGSKKSFVAADIALHVANGMTWQGKKVTQGRAVMIVAEGAGGLGSRLKAWEVARGCEVGPFVSILPRPVQAAERADWRVLVEACRRLKPALVVIDTQARVTVGLEENSAKEMGVYVEAVRLIREATGACVLTVHHTGRKGGDARGSSAIDGAQHTELKVESEAGKLTGRLLSEKQKDMELAPPVRLVFEKHPVGTDDDGEPITSLALVADAYLKAIGPGGAAGETVQTAVSEIEPWVRELAGTSVVRARLLQVVHEIGQGRGMTRDETQMDVAARWYGGCVVTKTVKVGLDKSQFRKLWNELITKAQNAGDREPVFVHVAGERWRINSIYAENPSHATG